MYSGTSPARKGAICQIGRSAAFAVLPGASHGHRWALVQNTAADGAGGSHSGYNVGCAPPSAPGSTGNPGCQQTKGPLATLHATGLAPAPSAPYIPAMEIPVAAVLSMPLPTEPGTDRLAEAAAHAEHDKGRVLLTRGGKAVAAVVPIEDVEALEAWEDEQDSRAAEEALARWEAEGRLLGATHEELLARYGITPDAE